MIRVTIIIALFISLIMVIQYWHMQTLEMRIDFLENMYQKLEKKMRDYEDNNKK